MMKSVQPTLSAATFYFYEKFLLICVLVTAFGYYDEPNKIMLSCAEAR